MAKKTNNSHPSKRDNAWWNNKFYTVLIAVALTGGGCAFFIPLFITSYGPGDNVPGLRQAFLAITGGTLAILTLWETRRKNDQEHMRQVHAERRTRYATAIEQLADEKAPIRLGGVYTLIKLVDEWLADEKTLPNEEKRREEGQVIVNSLCAYIRSPFDLASRVEVLSQDQTPENYEGGDQQLIKDQARFREEKELRLTILETIRSRLNGGIITQEDGTKKPLKGPWSDFDYDFSNAHFFCPVDFANSYFGASSNFSRVELTADADFSGAKFTGSTSFVGAEFTADSNFVRVEFTGGADFYRAEFTADSNFVRVEFTGGANFSEAKFTADSSFLGAEFTGSTSFVGAEFTNYADFFRAKFTADADFSGAKFTGSTSFVGAEFTADSSFLGAEFTGDAHFFRAKFTAETDFSESKFTKRANFSAAKFTKANFSGAKFTADTDFSEAEFTKKANFLEAKFTKKANFFEATFKEKPQFEYALGNKTYKARFSCKADPRGYNFEILHGSRYKIETEEKEYDGAKFIIPKGTELFDPDEPSEQGNNDGS